MSEASADLQAPVFLIAMPQVLDPFFHRSVVLLLHHDDEGSFGLILNRVTGIKVTEILSGMEIDWGGDGAELAYFGGPVQPQIGTVLFDAETAPLDPKTVDETSTLVAPGIRLTQNVVDLGDLAATPPASMRLFLGYAGWGAGQLVDEILRDDWMTVPVDPALVFAPDAEGIWRDALALVGVDPDSLPSWTPAREDGSTN